MKKQLTLKKLSLLVLSVLLFALLSLAVAFSSSTQAYAEEAATCPDGEHTLGEKVYVLTPQTCVSPGVGVRYCDTCHAAVNVVIPADGISHVVDADGHCKACNAENVGYVITENSPSEEYVEVGPVKDSAATHITIPGTVTTKGEEKKVHVDEEAFKGNTTITSVTIEGAAEIGAGAFSGCENLETVTMEEGTQKIGEGAFEGTKFYEEKVEAAKNSSGLQPIAVEIAGGGSYLLKVIDADAAPAGKARANAATPVSFEVPENTLVIADGAFKDITKLTDVELNAELITVGANAFASANINVYIKDGVKAAEKDGVNPFTNVEGLTGFNNIYYKGGFEEKSADVFKSLLSIIRYYSADEPTDNTHTYWHFESEFKPAVWQKVTKIELTTKDEKTDLDCTHLMKGAGFSMKGVIVHVYYENAEKSLDITITTDEPQETDSRIAYSFGTPVFDTNKLGEYPVNVTFLTYAKASYTVTVDESYTVTYKYGNGNADVKDIIWTTDNEIELQTAPTRKGYEFAGWLVEGEETTREAGSAYTVEGDITITAQWTAKKPAVVLDLAKGEQGTAAYDVGTLTAEETYTVTVKGAPTKTKAEFAGWTATVGGKAAVVTANQDGTYSVTFGIAEIDVDQEVKFTAQWTQLYVVTVTETPNVTVTINDQKNYYKDKESVSFTVKIDAGYKLIAVKANGETLIAAEGTYTATFKAADITITVEIVEMKVNSVYNMNVDKVEGTFSFWAKVENITVDDIVAEETHLIAGENSANLVRTETTDGMIRFIFSLATFQTDVTDAALELETVGKTHSLVLDAFAGDPWGGDFYIVNGYAYEFNGAKGAQATVTVAEIPTGTPAFTFQTLELKTENNRAYAVLTVLAENCNKYRLVGTTWTDQDPDKPQVATVTKVETVEGVENGFILWFDITEAYPNGEWIRASQLEVNVPETVRVDSTNSKDATLTSTTAELKDRNTNYSIGKDSYIYFVATQQHTLTLNYNDAGDEGAKGTVTKNVTHGHTETVETPTRFGYTFDGWYLDDGETKLDGTSVKVESDLTYTARWIPINITVTVNYEWNGVEETPDCSLTTVPPAGTFQAQAIMATLIVKEGYRATIKVNGIILVANGVTYENVQAGTYSDIELGKYEANLDIVVIFEAANAAVKYSVSVNPVSAGTAVPADTLGDIIKDVEGTGSFDEGTKTTVSFVVADGYGVTVTGIDVDAKIEQAAGGVKYIYENINISCSVSIVVTVGKQLNYEDVNGKWGVKNNGDQSTQFKLQYEWFNATVLDDKAAGPFGTLDFLFFDADSVEDYRTHDFRFDTPFYTYTKTEKYAPLNYTDFKEELENVLHTAQKMNFVVALRMNPHADKAKLGYVSSALYYATVGGQDGDGSERELYTYEFNSKPVRDIAQTQDFHYYNTTHFYLYISAADMQWLQENNVSYVKVNGTENFGFTGNYGEGEPKKVTKGFMFDGDKLQVFAPNMSEETTLELTWYNESDELIAKTTATCKPIEKYEYTVEMVKLTENNGKLRLTIQLSVPPTGDSPVIEVMVGGRPVIGTLDGSTVTCDEINYDGLGDGAQITLKINGFEPTAWNGVETNTVLVGTVNYTLSVSDDAHILTLKVENTVEVPKVFKGAYNGNLYGDGFLDFFLWFEGYTVDELQSAKLIIGKYEIAVDDGAITSATAPVHFVFHLKDKITGAVEGSLYLRIAGQDNPLKITDGTEKWDSSWTDSSRGLEFKLTGIKNSSEPAKLTVTTNKPEPEFSYGVQSVTIEGGEKLTLKITLKDVTGGEVANAKIKINGGADINGTVAERTLTFEIAQETSGNIILTVNDVEYNGAWELSAPITIEFQGYTYTLSAAETTLTLSATIIEYKVTFEADGVDGYPKTETVNFGDPVTVEEPKKDGFVFKGWCYMQGGEEKLFSGESIVPSDPQYADIYDAGTHTITLTAKFEAAPVVEETATLSFANTDQRISRSSDEQVWSHDGITLTNKKGTGNAIVDSSNPVKFYSGSMVQIDFKKQMKKIVFYSATGDYWSNIKKTLTTGTVDEDAKTVTLTLEPASTSHNFKCSGQLRLNSIDVIYDNVDTRSDSEKVADALKELEITQTEFTEDYILPTTTEKGVSVEWTLEGGEGAVQLVDNSKLTITCGDTEVPFTLKVKVSLNKEENSKTFTNLKVLKKSAEPSSEDIIFDFNGDPYTAAKGVWNKNGITITVEQNKSTAVNNYPCATNKELRCYKNHIITIEYTDMVKLEFVSTSDTYAKKLESCFTVGSNGVTKVTNSGTTSTIEFGQCNSIKFTNTSGDQLRIKSLKVYYLPSADQGIEGPTMTAFTTGMNGNGNGASAGLWLGLGLGGTALVVLSALSVVVILRKKHN